MSKHTPGPWSVHDGDSFDGGLIVYCADTIYIPNPSRTAWTIVVGASMEEGDKGWSEVEANAHLIAAAPDLIEVVRQYVMLGKGRASIGKPLLDMALAAIAKAEGP